MYDEVYHNKYGFSVPAEHIPTESDLKALSGGCEETAQKIISGYIKFVLTVVDLYLLERPEAAPYAEDARSEALLTLTQVVQSKKGSKNPRLYQTYIKEKCRRAIGRMLFEQIPTIKVPERSARRLGTPSREALSNNVPYEDDMDERLDLTEYYKSLTPQQSEIFDLWQSGLTIRQIGEIVGESHTTVMDKLRLMVVDIRERMKNGDIC